MRTERGAAPCISILVSDLLLHLGICEGFQKRAPLVSIPRVANRDFHSRQRVFTAAAGQKSKQHPSVLTVCSPGFLPRCKTQAQHSTASVSGLSTHSAPVNTQNRGSCLLKETNCYQLHNPQRGQTSK